MEVNVTAIDDRNILLKALWEYADFAYYYPNRDDPFNLELAKKELQRDGYGVFVCGKAIMVNVYDGDAIDAYGYDRHNGQGAMQKVVDGLLVK